MLKLNQIVENTVSRKQDLDCNGVINAYGLAMNEAVATVVVRLYIIEFLLSTIFYYPVFGQMGLVSEAVIFTISETIKVDIKNKKPGVYQRFLAECERVATSRNELEGAYENIGNLGMAYGVDNESIGIRSLVAAELEYMANVFTTEFMSTKPITNPNITSALDLVLETPTTNPEEYETVEEATVAAILPRVVWPYVHDVPATVFDTPGEIGRITTYDRKLPNLDYGKSTTLVNSYHELFNDEYWRTDSALELYGPGISEADFSPYEIPWNFKPYPQAKDNVVFSVGELMENDLAQTHPDAKSPREFFRK